MKEEKGFSAEILCRLLHGAQQYDISAKMKRKPAVQEGGKESYSWRILQDDFDLFLQQDGRRPGLIQLAVRPQASPSDSHQMEEEAGCTEILRVWVQTLQKQESVLSLSVRERQPCKESWMG